MASAAEVKTAIRRLESVAVDDAILEGLYGIRLPEGKTEAMWRAWRRGPIIEESTGKVRRAALEWFFQDESVLPLKWAAARIGTTSEGLTKLLQRLTQKGILVREVQPSPLLVEEKAIRDFARYFTSLKDRLFYDHSDFCRSVRAAAKSDLGLERLPRLASASAVALGEKDFAYEFDCITYEPIGLRHQVWLDFGKPMNLRPDVCGIHTYAAHRRALDPYLMGGERPTVPPSLGIH
jgi:hypothetical protein